MRKRPMCDVMSEVTALTAIISAIAGAAAAAEQEETMIEAADEANASAARQAIEEQTALSAADGIKQQGERQALADRKLSLKRDGMRKSAKAKAVSKGEGTAYDLLINDYRRTEGADLSVINRQLAMQNLDHAVKLKGYEDAAASRINSLKGYDSSYDEGKAYINTGLEIGSGMFDFYKAGKARQAKEAAQNGKKTLNPRPDGLLRV